MDPNEFYADALMNMDPVLKDMGLRPRYLRILLMWKPALTADEVKAGVAHVKKIWGAD